MTVAFDVDGRIAVLTLDRPEARNAVNGEVAQAFEAGLDRLEDDDGLWCGIVCATGPVFSAGADLKLLAAGRAQELATVRGGFAGFVRRERRKPLIAAVDGPALAGGCEIALACDLIVASTRAQFGLPEVKRSVLAAAGGLFRLPQALPRNVALHMALTGEPIDAAVAHHHGLVNVLCEPGEARTEALRLAARIAENGPLAVYASRRVLLSSPSRTEEENWAASSRELKELSASDDFAEGPRAFVEKRPPRWSGR